MIIAQWLYNSYQGTFWIAGEAKSKHMNGIGEINPSNHIGTNYYKRQLEGFCDSNQTDFRLEFIME
jgi:hypothetical protein